MTLFSKLRAQTITPLFKRNFVFKEGSPKDVRPLIDAYAAEPHADHLGPVVNLMLYLVIPGLSIYLWYQEYNHIVAHPQRPKFPKQDFLHQGVNRWPCFDGTHSCVHHPYFNFTPNGYETDLKGNRLPPGQYSEE